MTIGPPTKLTCPHCGGHKHILSILSGNTFGATRWSDSYLKCPMLEEPSLVQACPHCGKYFFYEDSKPEMLRREQGNITSFIEMLMDEMKVKEKEKKKAPSEKQWKVICDEADENGFGELTFDEADEAFGQLYSDDLPEKVKYRLLFFWLFAYNGGYGARAEFPILWECPPETLARREFVIRTLMGMSERNKLLVAELHRELGEFDGCMELASTVLEKAKEGEAEAARQILEAARRGETDVFPITRAPETR